MKRERSRDEPGHPVFLARACHQIKQSRKKMSNAKGAVARYLTDLQDHGGLKGTDIANITNVSKATVSRWKAGAMKPQPSNELIISDLYYIVGRLQEYYAADEIRTWLYALHPQLRARAIDLIHEGRSIEVLNVLDRLDSGVYL